MSHIPNGLAGWRVPSGNKSDCLVVDTGTMRLATWQREIAATGYSQNAVSVIGAH